MKYFVSEPSSDFKVACPYCGKKMNLIGPEGEVKKSWEKKGMATAASLKDTQYPLYLCSDVINCGGINVVESWVIGLNLQPGWVEVDEVIK